VRKADGGPASIVETAADIGNVATGIAWRTVMPARGIMNEGISAWQDVGARDALADHRVRIIHDAGIEIRAIGSQLEFGEDFVAEIGSTGGITAMELPPVVDRRPNALRKA